ncbi:hypothetical protein POTOM_045679 [Populus tomentosa]|uniref:UDP-glucose 4-epimerase n=1 Tax=Populus tomentosa TaxID=118781 RepID=A0A8X8CE75_POPTO|nr:hypothetical protein POTOM_045679 [Populus tomentosa]
MVGQTILVTGGAGFFGTHTVVQLLNEGFKVSIIDNHDKCVTEAVDCVKELVGPQLSKNLEFNLGDLRKKDDLEKLFSRIKFDAVIHFSGLKAVGDNSLAGTINLYEVMAKHNWKKKLVSNGDGSMTSVLTLQQLNRNPVHIETLKNSGASCGSSFAGAYWEVVLCAAKSSRKKLELLVLSFSMLGDNLLPFPIQSTAY